MSEQSPDPYGQPSTSGQQPAYGQPSPYGQQPAYGGAPQSTGKRPGTVTSAAWITIVFSALTAAIFGLTGLAVLVARDQVITAIKDVPELQDAGFDADAAVGLLVAVMVGLVVWCVVAIVLAVMVMRRSSVARILLVISASVTALLALLGIGTGISAVSLIAAVATIVLLFTGGAGDWFAGRGSDPYDHQSGPYGGQPTAYPSDANPYGQPAGADPYGQQPPPGAENPYGQQPPPGAENPYGQQPPAEGGSDYPPRDYPNR